MPTVPVYVRNDDYDQFKKVYSPEWLHNAIHNTEVPAVGAYAVTPDEVERPFVPSAPDPDIGYACCTKQKPCKHWQFDGVSQVWVNELTGKTRDV